jgi:hypothetical protein
VTRFATEPHRRRVGGVTWTRDATTGRYSTKVGEVLFEVLPVKSGRGGRSGPGGWDLLVEGRGLTGPSSWPIPQLTRALQEAGKLVRKERNKDDPYFRSPNVDPIEASRARAARVKADKDSMENDARIIRRFVDWLQSQGIRLCELHNAAENTFAPILARPEEIITRHLNIELARSSAKSPKWSALY